MLKSTSDDLIDLIDRMLKKDPESRIDNLEIFDHPWIKKYRYDRFHDDYGSEEEEGKADCDMDKHSSDTNSEFGEQNM